MQVGLVKRRGREKGRWEEREKEEGEDLKSLEEWEKRMVLEAEMVAMG